jgi:hypothetical protein
MRRNILRSVPIIAAAALLGACASDTPGLLPTASVAPAEEAAPKREARMSPECVALGNQIQTLRGDGTIERLEKVAAGKGDNVQVKRAAIAKQAELNKANADFLARCGGRLPPATTTAAAPAPSPAATKASSSGVTAATPAPKATKAN